MILIDVNEKSYWERLIKNMLIALVYPATIALAIILKNSANGESVYEILIKHFYILLFAIAIICYKLYRLKFNIKRIEVDSNIITINYEKFGQEKFIKAPVDDLSFVLRRDKSTMWEYYVLELLFKGGFKIKQYQYNSWDKDQFIQLQELLRKSGVLENSK